ncbi:MAG: CsgG/HfaB family protein [Desulfobacula sp.]|uniref:FG-GAP-like repeat-containing protein n=1 Tax=Desulfobacula sp. TaxID=2593537 RepID=UPI0025BCA15F|nr:FG-GAP-like repeat-containing protein [Desulfobacula sp.]MCD4718999.1 CsgG/HfaB family protein [Desulfobacula sp.]
MKSNIIRFGIFILTIVLSSIVIVSPGLCEPIKKVAVCPLEMNAVEDLSFLQKGLFSMLSSRLADPGKVEILQRETIDEALAKAQSSPLTKGTLNDSKARLIGAGLGVDYILFGSLTMFGKSVSLDMSMVDVKEEKPTLTFSEQAKEPGAVITELDQIATQINFKTFNRKPEQIIPQQQYAQRPERVPQGRGYASPLTNYRNLMVTNGEIIGISSGDVDGDKKNEVVIIYDHAIEILKDNLKGQLRPVKKIEDAHYMDIVGVDVADINHNGMAEIFISRVHPESGYAKSFVLEYNGTDYKKISKLLPWYLRVVKDVNGRDVLYAQKSGKDGPYTGKNVFKVNWQNNTYVPGEKLRVPEGFSVLSMATGDLTGTDEMSVLFTDEQGRLTIFNENGRIEWSGEEGYGGSKLYYTFMEEDEFIKDVSLGKGVYFQPRNIVFDIDLDGRKDVMVIKNKDASGNMFQQLRKFKTGGIEILAWNEMGLSPENAPKKMPGQITDIFIGDYDNNSKNELIITFIKRRNNFSSEKSKSMIIAYDM